MKSLLTALLAVCFSLPLVGDEKSEKEFFERTKAKAEKGDRGAQFGLGVMYDRGDGVPEDDKEALKWYLKAAEQGVSVAQVNVAVMYDDGIGVLEDDKEAIKWYRKAAEQAHGVAQAHLGIRYAYGNGVLEDKVTAYAWWNIAAANGNENAKSNKTKIAKEMTPQDISKAQALSKEMLKKNPKLLK